MKKFICTLLAILSVLGLCACGQPTNEAGVVMATQEPTKEERKLIVEYYYAVNELENSNPSATRQSEIYQELLGMTEYDKYTGTEYASTGYLTRSSGKIFTSAYDDEISTWNRKEVLARFSVLDDKLLSVTQTNEDRMGNQDTFENIIQWQYNSEGKMLSVSDENDVNPVNISSKNENFLLSREGLHEYDENGRLVKITHMTYDDITMVRTFTYDANGNLTQQVAKDNDEERIYTYTTENGRITAISWPFRDCRYEIVYTYEGDNLVSEVKSFYNDKDQLDEQWSMTHTYDSNGQRVESAYLWEDIEDTHWSLNPDFVSDRFVMYRETDLYTYEYVDGRISVVTCIPGSSFGYHNDNTVAYETAPNEAFIYYTLNYGPYSFYTAPATEN